MFKNEPFTDFAVAANRQKFQGELDALDSKIKGGGLSASPVVAGKELSGASTYERIDPATDNVVVGRTKLATIADADQAVQSLLTGFPRWRATPFQERARIIRAAGDEMARRKFELNALIVRESGKPWGEADGDTAEAIDFCRYYADEMLRLGPPQKMGEIPGEDNRYFYEPRGIGVIISPWNFPLAIACGMTTAALVSGNCAILKPAQQTSLIAARLAEILYAAGVPQDVLAFLPGSGSAVGNHLVNHPAVDYICFTGSKEVGLQIINKASVVLPGQRNVKRVVAEMGGKNAIIVDSDADLDEVIKGVIQSAFGFAGQKCSACSRLVVVGDAYEPLLERLRHAAGDIIVGNPSESGTFLPPVIDKGAQGKIMEYVQYGQQNHKALFQGQVPKAGCFVPASIFRDVPTSSRLWKEEIFGPVLACTQARDFDEAIKLANDSEYALTGGVFSRSPKNLEKAREEFRVGNLYINRKCTGALVYRQPFGGSRMSGVGSKAGGPDYLIQFMEPRTVTENTMRRGFAPA